MIYIITIIKIVSVFSAGDQIQGLVNPKLYNWTTSQL
jgi:hypothetical protein